MTKNLVIGLNSGTSFDGVDASLVKFSSDNKFKFIDGIIYEYPNRVKEKIRDVISGNIHSTSLLKELSQLNFLLGEVFADAALKIIKKNKLRKKDILLIASHGQTVFHHPDIEHIGSYKVRSTLQIGESSVISARTGIDVISNFREADIAVGGQGAPLISFMDSVCFGRSKNPKAILNIGGIANVTVVGKNITPIAFDIGPGNALIDLIARDLFKKELDLSGAFARKGNINYKIIEIALKDSFFKRKPPKTTGKEYFNFSFIRKYFSGIKRKEDKIATVTFFTAKVIQQAFNDFIFPKYKVNEIISSGGGVKNKTLMNHLIKLIPSVRFSNSDKYGLPYEYKEAILFALLGYTCKKKIRNNVPFCTGAKKKAILGKMTNV